jgi:hypothetical protein
MIAAVSAIVLFLVMFIFDWFGVSGGSVDTGFGSVQIAGVGGNAWQVFDFIDLIMMLTIIVALGLAIMAANAQSHNLPVAGSALVAGLGILCVLLILFRIIDPPYELDRKIGVFLGLIAAGGIAYGGFLGMQEEGTSFRDQGDRLQNRGPTDPPPPAAGGPPPAV